MSKERIANLVMVGCVVVCAAFVALSHDTKTISSAAGGDVGYPSAKGGDVGPPLSKGGDVGITGASPTPFGPTGKEPK